MAQDLSMIVFVRTGVLGRLAVGEEDESVHKLFGSPDDVGRGLGDTVIERYAQGRLEVSFSRRRVVLIAIYPSRGADSAGGAYFVNDLPAGVEESSDFFGEWLSKGGVPFDVQCDDGDIYAYRIHAGVTATFTDGRLDSLQAT